jgi:hypothetical protein
MSRDENFYFTQRIVKGLVEGIFFFKKWKKNILEEEQKKIHDSKSPLDQKNKFNFANADSSVLIRQTFMNNNLSLLSQNLVHLIRRRRKKNSNIFQIELKLIIESNTKSAFLYPLFCTTIKSHSINLSKYKYILPSINDTRKYSFSLFHLAFLHSVTL